MEKSSGLRFSIGRHPKVNLKSAFEYSKSLILAETEELIVVNKPARLLVHPSKPDGKFTLWQALRELLAFEIANGGQVSIINRLDRETSGVTLVAKTREAARKYSMLMAGRAIAKEYAALVWGWPASDHYEVDAPILRRGEVEPSAIHLQRMIHPDGAPAQTRFVVERRFKRAGEPFAQMRAFPGTGRIHQIRIHLAHLGHPVVGDKIYGPSERCYLEFIETGWTPHLAKILLLDRHALHSASLQVGSEPAWTAPLPADMAVFASS